jgi:hypothetical protein
MSGMFWGGLTNGLLGGYNAADQIVAREEKRQREERQDAATAVQNAAELKLKERQIDQYGQKIENDKQNNEANRDLLREEFRQKRDKQTADAAQQEIENRLKRDQFGVQLAHLGIQQAKAAQDAKLFNIELAAKERENAMKARLEKLPQAEAALSRWRIPGAEAFPEDVTLIKDVTGIDPTKFIDPAVVTGLRDTFQAVRAGKLNPNSPQAIQVAKLLYDPYLQRGIGRPHKAPDGRIFTVDSKEWAGLMPIKDKPGMYGVAVRVIGKDDQGRPVDYTAPATVHGTSDDVDDAPLLDDHTLELPATLAMLFHDAYMNNPAVKSAIDTAMQTVRGPKDRQAESAIDLNRARAEEARAKAANAGKGKPVDPAKIHNAQMDDIEKYLKADLGDDYGRFTNEKLGMARQIRLKASSLLKTDPTLTAEEAYSQAAQEANSSAEADSIEADTVDAEASKQEAPRKPSLAEKGAEIVNRRGIRYW